MDEFASMGDLGACCRGRGETGIPAGRCYTNLEKMFFFAGTQTLLFDTSKNHPP